ncbi:MAG: hypothetical protein M5U25_21100 [Planctomycetota bacterium]|nr:hypothetical protein [Planctomycetota bacterium]
MANNKKKRDLAEQLVELARKPGVIVTVLTLVGLTGQDAVAQANALLSMDLPAWTLLALVAAYIAARVVANMLRLVYGMAKDIALMRQAFEEFRDWTREQFADGGAKFDAHGVMLDDHGARLALIEDVIKAEILAYREKQRRETGKVKAKP